MSAPVGTVSVSVAWFCEVVVSSVVPRFAPLGRESVSINLVVGLPRRLHRWQLEVLHTLGINSSCQRDFSPATSKASRGKNSVLMDRRKTQQTLDVKVRSVVPKATRLCADGGAENTRYFPCLCL